MHAMESLSPLPLDPAPESGSAIARLSTKHDQIMNWLIANPHRLLRECAEEFKISQGWLSQLIHSDIFQAELKRRQEAVFIGVAQDIPTKLKGLADVAIEKVTRMVEQSEDPDLVMDAFDKTLHRLGYAPQKQSAPAAAPTQVNVFQVSQADLASARNMISGQKPGATLELHSQGGNLGGTVEVPPSLPKAD